MPSAGDRYEMPDGSVYALVETAAETGGEYVECEFILPDGCVPPPPHVHRTATEEYEVLEGGFEVMVDGEWRVLGPGDRVTAPRGALHTFRNRSGERVRVRNWHRPGVRFDEFIETMHRTLESAGVRGKRDPRVPLLLSKVFLDFPETLEPGRARERIPMRAMAVLGRLLA